MIGKLTITEADISDDIIVLRVLKNDSTTKTKPDELMEKIKSGFLKGKKISLEFDWWRKKRSLDANSYCWVLCQKIADELESTKEEIYRNFIRSVGRFTTVPIKNDDVDDWIKGWERPDKKDGIGWFAESLGASKIEGYTNIINYYGSSSYDSKQMWILLKEIIYECESMGIETMSPRELESLMSTWRKKDEQKNKSTVDSA